jgi:hypothetical protein
MRTARYGLVVVGLVCLTLRPSEAALCRHKKKGTLVVRPACTGKFVAAGAADLGIAAPPGAAPGGGLTSDAGGLATGDGGVGSTELADGAVTASKLAAGGVGPAQLGAVPAARVFHSAAQTAANEPTFNVLLFDGERFDSGLHTGADARLTAPIAGLYVISANVSWAGASAVGARELALRQNGATIIARDVVAASPTPNTTEQAVSTVARLAAGDYVEVVLRQNSGGSLDIGAFPQFSPEFAMVWVAPAP